MTSDRDRDRLLLRQEAGKDGDLAVTTISGKFVTLDNNVSKWDVSSVQITDGMFFEVTSVNGDISEWDVS